MRLVIAIAVIIWCDAIWCNAACAGIFTPIEQAVAAGDSVTALRLLNDLPSSAQDSAAWHALASQAYDASGEPAKAVAECEAALQREPTREAWHLQLGQIFLRYHTPKAALEIFTEALARFPDSILVRLGRGLAFSDLGLKEQAEADLRECLRRDPSLALAFDSLATLYLQSNRFTELIELARQFRKVNAGDYRSYYFESAALFAEHPDDREAEALVRESIRRNSRFAAAYALLGKLLLQTGRAAEAIAPLNEAIRLRPNYSPAYFYLSRAYRERGQSKEAEAALAGFRTAKQVEDAPVPTLAYHRGASR